MILNNNNGNDNYYNNEVVFSIVHEPNDNAFITDTYSS